MRESAAFPRSLRWDRSSRLPSDQREIKRSREEAAKLQRRLDFLSCPWEMEIQEITEPHFQMFSNPLPTLFLPDRRTSMANRTIPIAVQSKDWIFPPVHGIQEFPVQHFQMFSIPLSTLFPSRPTHCHGNGIHPHPSPEQRLEFSSGPQDAGIPSAALPVGFTSLFPCNSLPDLCHGNGIPSPSQPSQGFWWCLDHSLIFGGFLKSKRTKFGTASATSMEQVHPSKHFSQGNLPPNSSLTRIFCAAKKKKKPPQNRNFPLSAPSVC